MYTYHMGDTMFRILVIVMYEIGVARKFMRTITDAIWDTLVWTYMSITTRP